MKIILTGSTGFAGSEVLTQCIESPTITSIIVLSRRPLKNSQKHDKVNTIIMSDFRSYSPEMIQIIANADACIWCLGGTTAEAEIEFPLAFTHAMTQNWSTRTKPFRYIHCSGVLAERDQTKNLWFLQEGRRAKGQAETELLQFAAEHQQRGLWQTYIMRPSMIMPKEASLVQRLVGVLLGSVRVDELARTSIQLALVGNTSTIIENDGLVKLGCSTK
ncbi:hypothetical protein PMZ80_009812 [Knufia obscura]|uniref:NAD(P)-binding domain-containing protein n=2 Tax=Knufia TaxID=430999 RepID=A0AAN8EHE9_9EURO|nr:hypothetical protein PMZ80_009812 [Knufia obscura]KAK5955904.1 hypothetical protein OHC33_002477 [Knufia fluminis]